MGSGACCRRQAAEELPAGLLDPDVLADPDDPDEDEDPEEDDEDEDDEEEPESELPDDDPPSLFVAGDFAVLLDDELRLSVR